MFCFRTHFNVSNPEDNLTDVVLVEGSVDHILQMRNLTCVKTLFLNQDIRVVLTKDNHIETRAVNTDICFMDGRMIDV
jgi:hypothetical protein